MTLLEEADALSESPGQPYNGFFYNEMTRLASLPSMESCGGDLPRPGAGIDGAQAATGGRGGRVSAGPGRGDSGKVQALADPAGERRRVRRDRRSEACSRRASTHFRDPLMTGIQTNGIVTAACQASVTGELFLGFASGRVLSFRAERDRVVTVAENIHPVVGLAIDPDGATLVALCQSARTGVVSCFGKTPEGRFRRRPDVFFFEKLRFLAHPDLALGTEQLVGVGEGRELRIIDGSSGMVWQKVSIADEAQTPPVTGILLLTGSSTNAADRGLVVLTHDGPRWVVRDLDRMSPTLTPFRWQPGSPGSSTLCSVPIVSRFVPPYLDLLGLDASGAVHAVQFHAEDGCLELVAERVASTPGGYLAAARSGTYGVVAIARERIDWLNASAERFSVARTVNVGLRSAVACFSSPLTHEVLVVCADGFIASVLTPPPSSAIRA